MHPELRPPEACPKHPARVDSEFRLHQDIFAHLVAPVWRTSDPCNTPLTVAACRPRSVPSSANHSPCIRAYWAWGNRILDAQHPHCSAHAVPCAVNAPRTVGLRLMLTFLGRPPPTLRRPLPLSKELSQPANSNPAVHSLQSPEISD